MSDLKKISDYIQIKYASDNPFASLKEDDIITVYHGTNSSNMPMLYGVDATQEYHRHYGGPRHAGVFVAPDFDTARRFGPIVFELDIPVKDLHGSDYSGNTAAMQVELGKQDPDEIMRELYPDSFRPYLSSQMGGGGEPQGLFIGTIKPSYYKIVYYKDNWYDIDDIWDNAEYYKPYSQEPTLLKRRLFDATDSNISLEDLKLAIMKSEDLDYETTDKVINRMIERGDKKRFQELLEGIGWIKSTAKDIADNLFD